MLLDYSVTTSNSTPNNQLLEEELTECFVYQYYRAMEVSIA